MKHIWKLYQIIHCYTHTINLKALGLLDSNAFISIPQSSTRQLCKFLDTDRKAPLAGCPQRSKWKQGRRKTLITDFFFQYSCIPYTFFITLKPSSNPQAFQQPYVPTLQSPSHNPQLHFIPLIPHGFPSPTFCVPYHFSWAKGMYCSLLVPGVEVRLMVWLTCPPNWVPH